MARPVGSKNSKPRGWRKTASEEEQRAYDRARNARWRAGHPETYKALVDRSNRSVSSRYSTCKYFAKKRDISFALSKEDFALAVSQPCHYCGRSNGETGSGVDRMDNARGYEAANVVSCCNECNRIKGHTLTYAEALIVIAVLTATRVAA